MDDELGAERRRSAAEREPSARVVLAWLIFALVFIALVVGLVWMLINGSLNNRETIEGRPPRRGLRRRRVDASELAGRAEHGVERPERWSRAAAQEAAAALAFEQLSLELRAIGAPEVLISRARAAADDERRHDARCRAIALLAGEAPAEGFSSLVLVPMRECDSRAARYVRVARVAVESHLDGSINERRAAVRIRASAAVTAAPIGQLLAAVADDEDRHADLADDIVAWARGEGGRLTALSLAVVGAGA